MLGSSTAIFSLLLIALLALATAPFLSTRFLGFGWDKNQSPVLWIAEILFCYGLFLLLGFLLENRISQSTQQDWAFFVVSACLFLSAAFPAFAWRFLLKKH